jgi:hypothetical protein
MEVEASAVVFPAISNQGNVSLKLPTTFLLNNQKQNYIILE